MTFLLPNQSIKKPSVCFMAVEKLTIESYYCTQFFIQPILILFLVKNIFFLSSIHCFKISFPLEQKTYCCQIPRHYTECFNNLSKLFLDSNIVIWLFLNVWCEFLKFDDIFVFDDISAAQKKEEIDFSQSIEDNSTCNFDVLTFNFLTSTTVQTSQSIYIILTFSRTVDLKTYQKPQN